MNEDELTPLMRKLRDRKLPLMLVERLKEDEPDLDAKLLLMHLTLLEHHLIQHYEDVLYGGATREENELRVALSLRDAECDYFLRGVGVNPEQRSIRWWLFRSTLQCIALEHGLTGDIRPAALRDTLAQAVESALSHLRLLENYLDRFYSSTTASAAAKSLLDVYGTVLELNVMCVELSYWKQ